MELSSLSNQPTKATWRKHWVTNGNSCEPLASLNWPFRSFFQQAKNVRSPCQIPKFLNASNTNNRQRPVCLHTAAGGGCCAFNRENDFTLCTGYIAQPISNLQKPNYDEPTQTQENRNVKQGNKISFATSLWVGLSSEFADCKFSYLELFHKELKSQRQMQMYHSIYID